MPHGTGLIITITGSLVAAFIGGFIATKLRLPAIVGYLLAGIAIGPYTPGFTGNPKVAAELAEIGVILLMFGVGIHFSPRQLMAVRGIAVPGALGQTTIATVLGTALALTWGWQFSTGLVLGMALSVASTVVLLRALMECNQLTTSHGRAAVGWLIVEDVLTVLLLVLLPAVAVAMGSSERMGLAAMIGGGDLVKTLLLAIGKTLLFVVGMIYFGTRILPWFLMHVARTNSRELFTLSVLAVALGVAVGSAVLLGVSIALGAFLAGLVISESDQCHQAAADALPMRDAFSVLFFVSVGMLFDPAFLLQEPLKVLAILGVIVIGKGLAGFFLVVLLRYPVQTGLIVAAGLAQVGEFSFIVAQLARQYQLLPDAGYQLIVAGAMLSIPLNPILFWLVGPVEAKLMKHPRLMVWLDRATVMPRPGDEDAETPLKEHAIICGYGRVGSLIGRLLEDNGIPYVVIEQSQRQVEALRARGIRAYFGDASNPDLMKHVHLDTARVLILAIPDVVAARRAIEDAQRVRPDLPIIARTHSEQEWERLHGQVTEVVLGEREAAIEMARATLHAFGVADREINGVVTELRHGKRSGLMDVASVSSLDAGKAVAG